MRFNISIFVLAAAASSGVMAAPFAEPAANAEKVALERRAGPPAAVVTPALKWTSKQVLPNVVTAGAATVAALRVLFTNFNKDYTESQKNNNDQVQQPQGGNDQVQQPQGGDYYSPPGTELLKPE